MSFRHVVQPKWVSSFQTLKIDLNIFDTPGVWIINSETLRYGIIGRLALEAVVSRL